MDELKKVVMSEIDDDELDMVAGGTGKGVGHQNSNGKGHESHGNGKGLGHVKHGCDCCDHEEEEAAPASTGTVFVCPHCGLSATYPDMPAYFSHVSRCPKNPNACV